MSDVKTQILDELYDAQKLAAQNFDKGRCVGLTDAVDIINKHLEHYAIVPIEPTDEMMAAINNEKCVFQTSTELYSAILKAFKEQA